MQTRFDFVKENNKYAKEVSIKNVTSSFMEENIGKELASFLKVIIRSFKPSHILELGTGIGYATSVILNSTKDYNRELISVDSNKKKLAKAKEKLANFGYSDVKLICEDAIEFLKESNQKFNLILLDLNPFYYIELFSHIVSRQNSGDILLIHDALIPQIEGAPNELKSIMTNFNTYISNQNSYKIHKIALNDGFWFCIKN